MKREEAGVQGARLPMPTPQKPTRNWMRAERGV